MRFDAPGRETDFEICDEQARAAPETSKPDAAETTEQLDFFIKKDGLEYAGTHVIIDVWNGKRLDEPDHIETALIAAAKAAGATVLSSDFHIFTPNNGVSGVIVLAESHISIHTWPERNFAAIDVFMCGACNPIDTVPEIRKAFEPERIGLTELRRGLGVTPG